MSERDYRVLIVDDELDVALSLRDILRDRGYAAAVARDGNAALTACEGEEFDLCLLGVRLTDVPGDNLIQSIAEIRPSMEFIIMTGHDAFESAAHTVGQRSIIAYVTKPLDLGRAISLVDLVARCRELERALRESEQRFQDAAEQLQDVLYQTDNDGYITYLSPSTIQVFGWQPEEMKGRRFIDFLPRDQDPDAVMSFQARILSGQKTHSLGLTLKRKGGVIFFGEMNGSALVKNGRVVGTLGIIRDVTERTLSDEKLRDLSLVDELTGLNNRRGFTMLAGQQLKTADRLGLNLALIYMDLDGMKSINDSLGHREGDSALVDASEVIRQSFRASDIIARLGGDEFVGLAVETTKNGSKAILARLESNMAAYNARKSRPYQLSISYGVARYEPGKPYQLSITYGPARYEQGKPRSLGQLLERGDQLMYEHKRSKAASREEQTRPA